MKERLAYCMSGLKSPQGQKELTMKVDDKIINEIFQEINSPEREKEFKKKKEWEAFYASPEIFPPVHLLPRR